MLTELDRQRLEEIAETLRTPGWKHIKEVLRESQDYFADVRRCKNLDFHKGCLEVLDQILGWEARIGAALAAEESDSEAIGV